MYKLYDIFLFLFDFSSLSKLISMSTHVVSCGIIAFFLWLSNILLYAYIMINLFITETARGTRKLVGDGALDVPQ